MFVLAILMVSWPVQLTRINHGCGPFSCQTHCPWCLGTSRLDLGQQINWAWYKGPLQLAAVLCLKKLLQLTADTNPDVKYTLWSVISFHLMRGMKNGLTWIWNLGNPLHKSFIMLPLFNYFDPNPGRLPSIPESSLFQRELDLQFLCMGCLVFFR